MTCPACETAQIQLTGMYYAGCDGCKARSLASSPVLAAARGKWTPEYRQALEAAFGDDWQSGHEQVKQIAIVLNRLRGVKE